MTDDEPNSGLSGWAGVTLGRMWAEHERSTDDTLAWFANRRNPQASLADYQAAIQALATQNQALADEILHLKKKLAVSERNYNALDAWADQAQAELRENNRNRS
ncbi:hypothetical protein HN018_23280 (plasmid) [Lichenicola cladoniae]|uniref:Uncharacterized protein n=1 Tax=Lichenicola cladoniae TaxID=1484109 RepID=A0A6M8HYF1_9PROT|nr:hypothetical protein [Lichenicola cladoniae]NPD66358.1 hypothetical protein [Acetobacteraceae bacterium]QKE93111.1 hypothetical protein HN018_23280 [Lichenicola cladoniae]